MPETNGFPEIYADFGQISTGSVGVFLGFRAIDPTWVLQADGSDAETQSEAQFALKAVVRLTHEDAKIFAIMLKRALKDYEQEWGQISLPAGFAEDVNLSADEW